MRSALTKLAPAIVLLLSACARPAPPLPPVNAGATIEITPLTEQERINRCNQLGDESRNARRDMLEIEQVIQGRRGRDQLSAYLAALLYPPLLSTIDQQKTRKRALDKRQAEIDRNMIELKARSCPARN